MEKERRTIRHQLVAVRIPGLTRRDRTHSRVACSGAMGDIATHMPTAAAVVAIRLGVHLATCTARHVTSRVSTTGPTWQYDEHYHHTRAHRFQR